MEPLLTYTTYKCPKCGSRLEMIEYGEYVWFGCDTCSNYTFMRVTKLRMLFERLGFSAALESLYNNYINGK